MIELNENQREEWNQLKDLRKDHDEFMRKPYEERIAFCKRQGAFGEVLLKEGLVPKGRKDYLRDPDLMVGLKKSRIQNFMENGRHTKLREAMENPSFFTYLKYWVEGPDLPENLVLEFREYVKREQGSYQLGQWARAAAREYNLTSSSCEEFSKLGLELGLPTATCRSMRDSVKRMR